MGMSKELLIVTATIDRTVEDAWNDWYNQVHLPEIVACPGFLTAQRYVSDDGDERRYISIYELESGSALDSVEFAARRGWGVFQNKVEFKTTRFSRIAQLEN